MRSTTSGLRGGCGSWASKQCRARTRAGRSLAHRRYPYLLRQTEVVRPNQVWCADITYVPMRRRFCTWWRSWTDSAAT